MLRVCLAYAEASLRICLFFLLSCLFHTNHSNLVESVNIYFHVYATFPVTYVKMNV